MGKNLVSRTGSWGRPGGIPTRFLLRGLCTVIAPPPSSPPHDHARPPSRPPHDRLHEEQTLHELGVLRYTDFPDRLGLGLTFPEVVVAVDTKRMPSEGTVHEGKHE